MFSRFLQLLRAFFLGAEYPATSRVLVEQITLALRLQPVSITTQALGMFGCIFYFWGEIPWFISGIWGVAVLASLWAWGLFRQRFLHDADKRRHIRQWLRRWMMLSTATGLVWGCASLGFLVLDETLEIVILVSVLVAVVFASWPAFSCWIPGLTVMLMLSLTPMVFALAATFDVGTASIALVLLTLIGFVLYCGQLWHDVVQVSVHREMQNDRLVARLKSEKALAESAQRHTKAASERRARFFAAANHDLRQPLQAMGIYLQILQMQANDQTKEIINQLDASAKNISTLVEQLLEVSRIEINSLEIKRENVNIQALFDELEAEFAPVAAERDLVFQTRPLAGSIHTDPVIVRRILRNLITNAIRYSDKPQGRIVLAARCLRNGQITIGVYDQGPGIEPQDRTRIFEAFYRGASAQKCKEGHGLGLSIVKGLATRLGVALSVGSRVGKGTVFRLTFEHELTDNLFSNSQGLQLMADLDLRGVVGVLEDNDFVRAAVVQMLRSWGATVIDAATPTESFINEMIEAAQTGTLTALISDYNLGEDVSTGLEVIFMVLMASGRRVPSVLLTAVSEDEIRAAYRALCLNPDNSGQPMPVILQKPADAKALASALRRAVAEMRPLVE